MKRDERAEGGRVMQRYKTPGFRGGESIVSAAIASDLIPKARDAANLRASYKAATYTVDLRLCSRYVGWDGAAHNRKLSGGCVIRVTLNKQYDHASPCGADYSVRLRPGWTERHISRAIKRGLSAVRSEQQILEVRERTMIECEAANMSEAELDRLIDSNPEHTPVYSEMSADDCAFWRAKIAEAKRRGEST